MTAEISNNEVLDDWDAFESVIDSFDIEDPIEKINNDCDECSAVEMMCSKCGPCMVVNDDGIMFCKNCGHEICQYIDNSAEWRSFADDHKSSDPTRCGATINPLLPESSMSTVILKKRWTKKSGGSSGDKWQRLQKWQMPYIERSWMVVYNTITDKMVGMIPQSALDDAKLLYQKVSKYRISRGANRKGLIAACVFYALKMKKRSSLPSGTRTAKEVSQAFNIRMSDMSTGCKMFMEIVHNNKIKLNLKSSSSDDFIERFCNKLHMSYKHFLMAKEIAQKSEELGIVSENTPPSIAAGSIYLLSEVENLNLTKKMIAKDCGISEVTISKTYKKLNPFKLHLIKIPELSELESKPMFWSGGHNQEEMDIFA